MKTNSADISLLDFSALIDISTGTPAINLTNLSIMPDAASLTWLVEFFSPTGAKFYSGVPTGGWASHNTTPNFPKPSGVIEWSQPHPYKIRITVSDGIGQDFTLEKTFLITKPSGWDAKNKSTYGRAYAKVVTKCAQASLWVEDTTTYLYQGKTGTPVLKEFTLEKPAGDDGVRPASVTYTNFNSALIRIDKSGPGYQYYMRAVMDYAFDNGIRIRVKYLDRDMFSANCNIDLSPIVCELQKLMDEYEAGGCKDAALGMKLTLINGHLHTATQGIVLPQSGIDPFAAIEKIKKLTGWECDCCSTGISTLASISAESTPIAYEIVSDGGDITGYTEIIGGTLRIRLRDKHYTFVPHPDNTTVAFTVDTVTAGDNITYRLKIDTTTLANEILTAISENSTMLNRLNEMITGGNSGGGSGPITVDPKCVLPMANSCDYTFSNEGFASTLSLRSIFFEDGTSKAINFLFTGSADIAALESRLANLGLGAWDATYDAGLGKLTLTSSSATRIKQITHAPLVAGPTDSLMTMTKRCDNATHTFQSSVIIQALINYACQLGLSSIRAGRPFDIKQLVAIGGEIKNITVRHDATLDEALTQLVGSYNSLVGIVHGIKAANCELIGTIFNTPDTDGLADTDQFLIKLIGGECRTVTPKFIAAKILDLATRDSDVKALLCTAVQSCNKPVCQPVTGMSAVYNPTTGILSVTIPNSGAVKYNLAYYAETTGRPALQGQETVNATQTANTTHQWTSVPAGTWNVIAVPVCADSSQGTQAVATTAACQALGSFSATLDTNSRIKFEWGSLPSGSQGVRVELTWPNGGTFTQNYPVTPAAVWVNIPSGVSGDAQASARNICSTTGVGWYSAPSASVKVNIPAVSTCPNVIGVEILDITATTVRIRATKPAGVNVPLAYTLVLSYGNNQTMNYTTNSAGSTVEWNITQLTPNQRYGVFILSNCEGGGQSDGYNGGRFFTALSGSANSSLINLGTLTADQVYVQVNGTLVYHGASLAGSGGSVSLAVADYTAAEVRITPCYPNNTIPADGTIESNGTTYHYNRREGQTLIFDNVNITNGMIGRFTDVNAL